MANAERDKHLSAAELRRMIHAIRPEWRLESHSVQDAGRAAIYEVRCSTPNGIRGCFLKATPVPDDPFGIGTEARLTETVRRRTDIPAPPVIGAVDSHETVRAPYFLMEAMPGQRTTRKDRPDLPSAHVRSLARQTGRFLGQLHEVPLPNVNGFGEGLSHAAAAPLAGEKPNGDPNIFVLPDGAERWTTLLEGWIDADLDRLAETERFADLVSPVEAELTALVDVFPQSFAPVIGRVDHGLWNLLTDADCRRITAVLDWGALMVVPPAYDLSQVEYHLAGGIRLALDDVPDRCAEVRDAIVDGYTDIRPMPDTYDVQRRCYQLDTVLLHMLSLESDTETPQSVPASRTTEAAEGLRSIVEDLAA